MYQLTPHKKIGLNSINQKKRLPIAILQIVSAVSLFIASGSPNTEAAFELNFKPLVNGGTTNVTYQSFGQEDETGAYACNNISFQSNQNCLNGDQEIDAAHNDGTPIYNRVFRDNNTGKYYWHFIMGDYYDQGSNPVNSEGFHLEYIIEANSSGRFDDHIATSRSASATWTSSNTAEDVGGYKVYDTGTNGTSTTSGYANPTKVLVRQIMEDGETVSTFLKDDFDSKPFISQTVVDNKVTDPNTNVNNEFTLDMRAISYSSSDNSGIIITNKTDISGGLEAANQGDYDTTDVTQTAHIYNQEEANTNGGTFTWANGTGTLNAAGTYTYYESDGVTVNTSGFDPKNKNYQQFCDPTYNVNWSGNGACKDYSNTGNGWGRKGWD